MAKPKTFKDLVIRMIEIKKEQDEAAIRKKELSIEWSEIAAIVQKQMEARDELEVDLGLGYKLAIRDNVRGIMKDAPKFISYLIDTKNDGLSDIKINPSLLQNEEIKKVVLAAPPETVSLAIQWNALAAFLKDVCNPVDKETWPPGCDVNIWQDVILKKGKIKK